MTTTALKDLKVKFASKPNKDWAFTGVKSIDRFSHGYHRYPAKFLPQLVKKIIETYSVKDAIIVDVFAGCGTTLVESKAHGISSIGVDINPVAELITKAKINPIDPRLINSYFYFLSHQILDYNHRKKYLQEYHPKINYWFRYHSRNKIAYLYYLIFELENEKIRDFFLCALSNILKNCSKWLQSSTKPQIDPDKIPADPFISFRRQVKMMIKKNKEFYDELQKNGWIDTECRILLADARKTGLDCESVNIIITSPPYVTSYEYADIHQLTGYWYNYFSEIEVFRRDFIGTFYSNRESANSPSIIAGQISAKLKLIDKRIAKEVSNYFKDMYDVALEMKRILKPKGVACIVVGNTKMKEVSIKSAEVFAEHLLSIGFELVDVIKREIPHKLIPTIRDKKSGRFSKLTNKNSKRVYPEEFVIIARKK